MMVDIVPEDGPADESAGTLDEPPKGEEDTAGADAVEDTPEQEGSREDAPAEAGHSSEIPVEEPDSTNPEDDAPGDTGDDGPKEAEFPPIEPAVDEPGPAGGEPSTDDAPV